MTQHIHLIAICGTAMGTLAGMLKEKGFRVTGSDQNIYPPMSDYLESWGILVSNGFSRQNLDPRPDLVVVGNAVSKTNPEVEALLEAKIPYLSVAEALQKFFLNEKKSLVVAGTHGKTTTTSLLAWVLFRAGLDPAFLVGGIPKNFDRSFRLGQGSFFVIEGDEYDTAFFDKGPKFWHYSPWQAIITSVEFDHADIYRDFDHLFSAFKRFVELIPKDGALHLCGDLETALKLREFATCPVYTYGLSESCNVSARLVVFDEQGVRFRLFEQGRDLGDFFSPLWGRHNLQNLLGVISLSRALGLSLDTIAEAVSGFQGVKRRQEVFGTVRKITLIDDFAHHPTAVFETLQAIRRRFPNQRLWAVFEPRSNTSRRSVFQKEFVNAFKVADCIVLSKVHLPEKVKDGFRLDEKEIADPLAALSKSVWHDLSVDEIVEVLAQESRPGDVIVTMSNGGFGGIQKKILERLA